MSRRRFSGTTFAGELDVAASDYSLSQQVVQLQRELASYQEREQGLLEQITQLRATDAADTSGELNQSLQALREHLQQHQGVIQFPINQIRPNPQQPRQSFAEEVTAMTRSLALEGQLEPLLIFPSGMLFDGECRWRAATDLGWQDLEVIILPEEWDEITLRRRAYLAGIHRATLNYLDRAEALIAIVCDQTEVEAAEVPRIVSRVCRRLSRTQVSWPERIHLCAAIVQRDFLIAQGMEGRELEVLAILLNLQEHPLKLERNIFRTLSLAPDLKQAVRQHGLSCHIAMDLNRLTAKVLPLDAESVLQLRSEGVRRALDEGWSVSQASAWVRQQLQRFQSDAVAEPQLRVQRFVGQIQSFTASLEPVLAQLTDADLKQLRKSLRDLEQRISRKSRNS